MAEERWKILIKGIIQGVGFRPFIYKKAVEYSLKGYVKNYGEALVIEVEGQADIVRAFLETIRTEAPPLSIIASIDTKILAWKGYRNFEIRKSSKIKSGSETNVYISPDIAVCEDCRKELFDSNDRRYLYPFINCTNCGPRFSIITGIPYDRINTTMHKFAMCDDCAAEYSDPSDRRYHAQPVACSKCGPCIELLDGAGKRLKVAGIRLDGDGKRLGAADIRPEAAGAAVLQAASLIFRGKIIAIKGIGGYHLTCNAFDAAAVRRLRQRKTREEKPFAVMVADLMSAMELCHINESEKLPLESEKRPIVLLRRKSGINLPDEIAPGNPYLGIMLPYAPLHYQLFEEMKKFKGRLKENKGGYIQDGETHPAMESSASALVMTSGNRSNEPIYYLDDEAVRGLRGIADYFLVNDRDIYIRTDDSVTRIFRDKEYIIRRSRGYVPLPVRCDIVSRVSGIGNEILPKLKIPAVLACGGELKNTFCMNKGEDFYLSHHIGDLENYETFGSFKESISHFSRILDIQYSAIAYDLHPGYLSSEFAANANAGVKIAVQHHHAHIASCMAENRLSESVIGVAFDGTGFGEDGQIWGGEIFTGSYGSFKRAGHLKYMGMPGGEAAVREPWRMALSYLYSLTGIKLKKYNIKTNENDVNEVKIEAALQLLGKGINTPQTSSMGRLFDAVSCLLGIRNSISYEGQAAIELERAAVTGRLESGAGYSFKINDTGDKFIICMDETICSIINDMEKGLDRAVIALKFHETIAEVIVHSCKIARDKSGLLKVVLSGGVFQNMLLLGKSVQKLEDSGFEVFTHCRVPANDGGISLGQAVIAIYKILGGKCIAEKREFGLQGPANAL